MPAVKRSRLSYNARYKRARRTGTMYRGLATQLLRRGRVYAAQKKAPLTKRVNNLYRMIETKEATHKIESGLAVADRIMLTHNQLFILNIEPFRLAQGAGDAMGNGLQANRIGDKISIKGLMIRGQIETAQNRPKVYFRIALVRCAKGDVPDRTTFFKNNCDNKMLDQVNTERYSIIAQRVMNVTVMGQNATLWNNVSFSGEPNNSNLGGIGTRNFSMWIPGHKIVRGGNMQFENNSFQPKFFDYKIVCLAYDHVATAQDVNQVLQANCIYTKCYFKDA